MKHLAVLCGIAALAGTAMGGTMSRTPSGPVYHVAPGSGYTKRDPGDVAVAVNLSGLTTWDLVSDASNTVLLIDMAATVGLPSGSAVSVTGIGWDVTVDTLTPAQGSFLSQARMYFDDNLAPDLIGVFLAVGAGQNAPGIMNFASAGNIDLSDAGIPNILLPNGILRLELYETFDNAPDAIDAVFSQGGITVVVTPAPGAMALLGLGGLVMARRRR